MKKSSKLAVTLVALATFVIATTIAALNGGAAAPKGFQIAVDEHGKIRLPDIDFRKDWAVLGAWAVAEEDDEEEGKEGAKGLHLVYTQPESVAVFRKTGKFPDGTILVKELLSTITADMTTGTISRANQVSGWFVMVKDTKNRYPKNKLWGDGWGWAYFDAKDRINTTSTDYKVDCKGCHIPAQNSDWIYIEGYPVLQASKHQ